AGPMPSILTPDDAELHWVNYLKGGTLPSELEVDVPQSHLSIPIASVVAVLLALGLIFVSARQRSWAFGLAAVALLAGSWLAPPIGMIKVPVAASIRTPSGDEARPTIHALLYNVYRALDFRQEEVVFDRLAQSLAGDVLEQVYLAASVFARWKYWRSPPRSRPKQASSATALDGTRPAPSATGATRTCAPIPMMRW
ncbi:MAG: hypothetical protein JRH14_14900, partial [Deltaproteobacteria bacterium]|nr:hypothetical protein [Deltaproteobacteria bacterium]